MRYRRRMRRTRTPQWGFAGNGTFAVVDSGAAQYGSFALMPPARVNWVLDTDRVDAITYHGSLLWLDFHWFVTSGTASGLPDVEFYVFKGEVDPTGAGGFEFAPFAEPTLPTALTNWDSAPVSDGTDPFLWTHYIKGSMPPNSAITTTSGGTEYNQLINIKSDGTNFAHVCRKFSVAAEWQPDIHIKSRRRLMRTEGVFFVMRTLGTNTQVTCHIDYRFRSLYNRGR